MIWIGMLLYHNILVCIIRFVVLIFVGVGDCMVGVVGEERDMVDG